MAVTKRTRFEVLRRDKHTCQYCGEKAPDVPLHIDHVVPVSLGGDDKPGNLVAACKDCNSGKSSIAPDAPLVQGLSERAASYALGMTDKMTRFRASVEAADAYIEEFDESWSSWRRGDEKIPLPPDYELSLFRWSQMGVPMRVIDMAIPKAMKKQGLHGEYAVFQYLAGIVWRMVDAHEVDYSVTEETAKAYTEGEVNDIRADAYHEGYMRAKARAELEAELEGRASWQDFVMTHIDGYTSPFIERYRLGGNAPWQETERVSA